SEVSFNEISKNFGLSQKTVERYIEILEKAFIIFRLQPFADNKRLGLRRTRKVFFWDLGLRNSLINSFESIDLRPDKGGLFENYVISEFLKLNFNSAIKKNYFFWRSYSGEEIDLIEEVDGKINGYEMKWKSGTDNLFKSEDAPVSVVNVIDSLNVGNFLKT
ncbi:DUF4143 domain-containing protein, partial [Candidatus Azambacteria bacterium]|nr:DUF4143 domain-containing protein [Candidatus Azambacteria bacterium]